MALTQGIGHVAIQVVAIEKMGLSGESPVDLQWKWVLPKYGKQPYWMDDSS